MGESTVSPTSILGRYPQDVEWIKIERLSEILDQFTAPKYHPQDPRYREAWNEMRKKCIEGIWFPQFGGYRHVPGRLGFYAKYCTIVDTVNKVRHDISPDIRDLEWHFAYYIMEAMGFSGFEDDDEYTCNYDIYRFNDLRLNDKLPLINKNGDLKKFITPREYLFKVHDKPLGRPLYHNANKNHVILGSRGGGKSFSIACMVIIYELVFHGARYADAPIGKAEVEVGSGISSKSSEFLDKVESSIRMLSELPKFGVYGEPEDEDYEPSPFYVHMQGSLKTNNHKNPWTQYRDVKKGNNWKKVGNFDKLYHTVYSDNKKEGAESAAGGRRVAVVYEEMGLMKLIKEAWGSNNAVVATDGIQFGSQIGIGTSGNIELIQYTKHIFTHPKDYNLLDFNGHAFFLPAPLVDKRFKDENGNTDLEKAYEFYHNEREKAKLASDPQVLISHRMNLPLQIDDMWLGGSSGYLPEKEAEEREKELIRNNLYESIGQAIELYWDSGTQSGVNYRIKPLSEAKPIYNWPLSPSDPTHGEVMIYIHPDKLKINGVIPNDAVIILHDPYVSDELDKGGSLGASYVIVNPKYESFGLPSYQIAATWISRHPNGVDGYNDVFEKLIQFYGNPIRGVWYEANRGDRFRGHMIKKHKASLLCVRPQFEQGQFIYSRNATQTGYMVSNRIAKVTLLDGLRDLLLTDIGGKLLIETIPCLFTIKQMRQFTMDGNFDGISALQGLPLAVNELEHYSTNKQSSGIFDGLTKNLKNALNRTQQRQKVV